MPLYVLPEGTQAAARIPAHLTHVPIPLITTAMDCFNKSVKGKVISQSSLVSVAAEDFMLKTIIEDLAPGTSSQHMSINVVVSGAIAKEFSQTVNQGDVLVVSGFTVAPSSTADDHKVHPCHLRLSGNNACLYLSRQLPPSDPKSPSANKRNATRCTEVVRWPKVPKYTYVKLDELKNQAVVNLYGVVVFFKPPFKSRGSDFCSSLKITDQSNQRIVCTIFCDKLESHPKIFRNGDIIRLHRVKAQVFNGSMTLINTRGFSAVTFDGAAGGPVEPRASSPHFHFDEEDRQIVEELRSWAATQTLQPPVPTTPLSAVQPRTYFDLTCQLLAKAVFGESCALLRVWDGTHCPYPLLQVMVESSSIEGQSSFSKQKENLIANVLVYDNHVLAAKELKPGVFMRIYNLRAIPGTSKIPGLANSQVEDEDRLAFHLHGGTAYGRGIRVLPQNSPDVQELQRTLEKFQENEESVNDTEMMDVWCTPPETLGDAEESMTELSCGHNTPVTLSQVKRLGPGGTRHVRVQLKSYQPRQLYQALKLYCSNCKSIVEVPDDELLADLFSEARADTSSCSLPPWMFHEHLDPADPDCTLSVHLSHEVLTRGRPTELLYLRGATLEEMCLLAEDYPNIVPVRSSEGRLALCNLSAPFLIRGRKKFFGCKQCSVATVGEVSEEAKEIDEKAVAAALGVQLLQFVLVMKLELQDATDALDVFLWRDAELFFGVSAEDSAVNQEAQGYIQETMALLCPPEGSTGGRPWLNLCLTAYCGEDENGRPQTCYQICHSKLKRTFSPRSEQNPS